jgi:rod shape-determining protein MreD
MAKNSSGTLALLMTIAIGLVLQIYPLPESLQWWRPSWLLLTMIYWVMALPNRVGIVSAWLVGLVLDVSMSTHLGVHGATFAICAYIVFSLSNRLRLFTLWQQSLFVGLLVGFDLVVSLWIENFIEYRIRPADYWYPMISSTLVWPISFILLRHARRTFHIR